MMDNDFEKLSREHLDKYQVKIIFLNIFSIFLAFVKKNL